ncbi:MAG: hypothetical protein Q8K59_01355 [Nitrosomonas sp.]|nr:hypothetical protein [Nitrosomonas sp.]
MTKRGKQASRKAAARKYGFLKVPIMIYFHMTLQPSFAAAVSRLMSGSAR